MDEARDRGEPAEWDARIGLSLLQAQDLLDWLEANGFGPKELTFHPEHGFTVRWHQAGAGTSGPGGAHPVPRPHLPSRPTEDP